MNVDTRRVLKSLHWDLGIRRENDSFSTAITDLVNEFSDTKTYNLAAGELAHEVRIAEGLDASRVYRYVQILDAFTKQPGNLDRSTVIAKLLEKQNRIGCVSLDTHHIAELRRIILYWISSGPDGFEDLVKHGPGATADRVLFDDKWHALRDRPPSLKNLYASVDPIERLSVSSTNDYPARVIVVEKNYKGGRVIAAEQTSRQFVQQGLGRLLVSRLERRANIHISDVDRHVEFLRNTLDSSVTVDLSDASDYVSAGLIAALFPRKWVQALMAARSHKFEADNLVSGTRTMSMMGSGTCFPVLTIVCAALCALASGRWKAHSVWSVFGDDIIIAEPFYWRLRNLIARAGLLINYKKTFTPDCNFAETCGVDLVRTCKTNVRPKFVRFHDRISDIKDLIKLCEFQRYVGYAGYNQTASYLRKIAQNFTCFSACDAPDLPGWVVDEKAPSYLDQKWSRWNKRLQRLEVKAYVGWDPERVSSMDVGESWAKATFGSDTQCETLSRSNRFKISWIPLVP